MAKKRFCIHTNTKEASVFAFYVYERASFASALERTKSTAAPARYGVEDDYFWRPRPRVIPTLSGS
jgi:hypothetical protein